jgi:ATP-dependent DNA helicase HFM1/MER3
VEVVDLAEELSPMRYSKFAPLEYRKLHKLRASVQKSDTSVRLSVPLPKQQPRFSCGSGQDPELPFLLKDTAEDDGGIFAFEESDGEEDLPSPSRLVKYLKGDSDDPFKSGNVNYEGDFQASADPDDSLASLEAGIFGMDESVQLRVPTPKVSSSFANKVFDFDAFDEKYGEPDIYSSSPRTRKRERSQSLRLPEAKHRRISQDDTKRTQSIKQKNSAASEVPVVEGRRIKVEDLIENTSRSKPLNDSDAPRPKDGPSAEQRSVPEWVNEFDTDLIESLIGIVDFVE